MPDGTNGLTGRGYKPYPAYKDSGVTWIGQVPAHWSVRAFRRSITRIEQGWSPVAEDRLAAFDEWAVIKLSAVSKGTFDSSEHKALPADVAPDTRYEICEGDFLVTRANTPELVGDACVVRGVRAKLMLSDLVYRLRLKTDDVQSTFLAYWLVSRVGRYQIEVDARGSSQSMVKVSQGHIRDWMLLLPSLEEQQAIVTFLDYETGVIDALVAKKERLIELLQEKRTALITRAVTKGLDPNVQMKDSGVEWLGQIPAHWEAKKTRDIAHSLQTGPFGSQLHANEYVSDGIPVINPANIRDGKLVPDSHSAIDDTTVARLEHHRLLAGDILFARRGELGRCGLVTHKEAGWVCGTGSLRLRPRTDLVEPRFLLHLLSTSGVRDWLHLRSVGSTMENLNTTIIGRIPVALPLLQEQRAVAGFLDDETARMDMLLIRVRQALERLQELRTSLISAAVTGKIDVRGEARELPEDR